MNILIAKVSDKHNPFRKISTDKQYFRSIDKKDVIKYNPGTLLGDGQWFMLERFDEESFCLDYLKKIGSPNAGISLKKIDVSLIEYIFAYQNEHYYFQRVLKSNYVTNANVLTFGQKYILFKPQQNIIVLNDEPDAVYDKTNKTLYFKKLERISSIFKGIDILYKEATNSEVEDFLNESFMSRSSKIKLPFVGKNNRKRIALVKDKLKDLEKKKKTDSIIRYINEYVDSKVDGKELLKKDERGAYIIDTDNELKYLLYGIEERFYTTEITNKKRVANSTIDI